MPELPEVEITARLIGSALAGARVESALAPGRQRAEDLRSAAVGDRGSGRRRASGAAASCSRSSCEDDLTLLIHLMSAGRLQLFDTRASLRDRTSRLLIRLDDGRELRLREFGTKQAAWVKLLQPTSWRRGDPRHARSRGLARSRRRSARCSTRPGRCTACCATST